MKQQIQKNTNIMQEQKTVAVQAEKLSELEEYICRQEKEKIEANDYGRTIGYYSPVRGNDYVTGWLVCVKGREKGRDYRLHHGINRHGRSMDMEVFFSEDRYDGKSNHIYIVPGKGTLTYVNQELLEKQRVLRSGDRLYIGDSIFEFIAYCREGHTWEEEE